MLIYSMKPDHDGGVAVVDSDSQKLVIAYEAEKDSFPRYSSFNPVNMLDAACEMDRLPDVFAISGWGRLAWLRVAQLEQVMRAWNKVIAPSLHDLCLAKK